MFNFIGSVIRSSTTASLAKGGSAAVKGVVERSRLGPSLAFGGSLVAGVAAMFIGGFKIVDCVRYQTEHGQCDLAIEKNLPAVIGGAAALAGCWGGFNTYNPKLHEKGKTSRLAEKGLVVNDLDTVTFHSASPEYIKKLYDQGTNQSEISRQLGISRYAVKKALQGFEQLERGR